MGSRPSEFIRNLGTSVSQLVDPLEREDMVRTAARAAVEGVAAEVDQLGPDLLESLPATIADAVERATRAAVKGGVLELEATLPELHATLTHVRLALDQYVKDHTRPAESGKPGPRMQRLAQGAVRGAAAELRRLGAREDWGEVEAGLELAVEMVGRRLVAGMASELRAQVEGVEARALIEGGARAAVAGAVDGLVSGVRRSGLERWRWPAALVGIAALLAVGLAARR